MVSFNAELLWIDSFFILSCLSAVVLVGNRFWVFKDTTLQPTYPKDISLFGTGMPTQSIETAVWWEGAAKTYFFKGDRLVLQTEPLSLSTTAFPCEHC